MTMSPTKTGDQLPWGSDRRPGRREEWHLVLAWSLDEPWRVGESAAVREVSVLGRGGPQPDDDVPRLVFHTRRPGDATPRAPLAAARVSRTQLRLTPMSNGQLQVESVGKCTLLVDGDETTKAAVDEGAVLELRNSLVLYVIRRASLEPLTAYPAPTFPFGEPDPCGVVGESAPVWRLRDELAMAARGPHHVLLQGDSGSGKELAARAVHLLSARSKAAFVARNAATFPEGLVDAELFGNVKNYPNSGSPERPGLIGEADGGTLFLDEIGELPVALQAHLLRVLDKDGEYQRLGESKMRKADIRLVAATNRPLDALKHDLVARFSSRVQVPRLVMRREDIPILVRHILTRFAKDTPDLVARLYDEKDDGRPEPRIDPRLIVALMRHEFTHNLRELERLLWLATTTTRDPFVALTKEVEAELRIPAPASAAGGEAEPDAEAIRGALAATQGNVSAAAKKLGLKNRYQLYRIMKRHGIVGAEGEGDEG